jgi:hypothetical protein
VREQRSQLSLFVVACDILDACWSIG